MASNRDEMANKLQPVYGSTGNLADWEGMHWVAQGFEPAGPGDKASWYQAAGASGTYYGDLEYDYWVNVFTSTPFFMLQEDGFKLLQEDGVSFILV